MRLSDVLLLGNDCIIPQNCQDLVPAQIHGFDPSRVATAILDQLVTPLREAQIDDTEIACLKAVVFFNHREYCLPGNWKCNQTIALFIYLFLDAPGLSDPYKIDAMNQQIWINLENYISDRQYQDPGRLGKLARILPCLRSISRDLIELIQTCRMLRIVQVDNLIQEMLLGGS